MNQHNSDAASLRMALGLEPEERLLLICARLGLSAADRDELTDLLEQPLPWDRIVDSAQWHKLEGLLFYHLRGPEYSSRVPKPVLEVLQGLYRRNVARQLYYRAELGRVLQALHAQGIPVIVLKGAALVETVYPEPGLRPMVDLDLLVPNALAHQAQSVVCRLGYQPGGCPEDYEDTERNHRHLPTLVGIGKPLVVEIHRHLVRLDGALGFDIEQLWERAQDASIGGAQAKVLSVQDLLSHLALNFMMDRRYRSWAALGQLCDISEAARYCQGTQEWSAFVATARQLGLAGPTACALFVARQLLDAPVPPDVVERLWPRGFPETEMTRFVLARVLERQPWVARELVPPGSLYGRWPLLRAMVHRLVPSRRYMISRYGARAQGKAGLHMYFVRLGQGLSTLFRLAVRPSALGEDLSVDRWLHSLYGPAQESDSAGFPQRVSSVLRQIP